MVHVAGRLRMPAVPVATTLLLLTPSPAYADAAARIDLTQHPVGYAALLIFFVAYGFVAVEEVIQLRGSHLGIARRRLCRARPERRARSRRSSGGYSPR